MPQAILGRTGADPGGVGRPRSGAQMRARAQKLQPLTTSPVTLIQRHAPLEVMRM